MKKWGVFLARFQPLHVAHLFLIEKALSECENICIVLGSENKKDMVRNPFSIITRKDWLMESLREKGYRNNKLNKIVVFELPDWSLENDVNEPVAWGRYLYYNVVSRIKSKRFSIYYSDDSEIINRWFESEVKEFIDLRLFDRSSHFEGLSATKIREAILNDNFSYLNKYLPKSVMKDIGWIKNYYMNVLDNPQDDYSMN